MIKQILVILILYIFLACATEYNRQEIIRQNQKYLSEGKIDRAYQEFTSELRQHFEDIELHKEFIRFISKIHRCEDAYRFYEQNRSDELKYIYFYSRALLGTVCGDGKKDEIIRDFSEAVKLRPDNYEIRLRFGAVLMEYELYKNAMGHFKAIKSLNSTVYSYMALCDAYLGNFVSARDYITKTLEMDFSDQDFVRINSASDIINSECINVPLDIRDEFKKLFDLILVQDRPTFATGALESLIAQYPSVYALRLIKGMSLALMGEYSSALYELKSTEGATENCSYFQYTEGIIYLGVQKEDKAISCLENAIKLDPVFVRAYRILSEIYLNKKDYIGAERVLKIYLKLEKNDHKSRFVYGRLLVKLKKINEAANQFDYIYSKEPENIFGIVGKGMIEREFARIEKDETKRKRHLEKSLEYLNSAIKKDSENQEIKNLIKSIDEKEE